MPLHEFHDRGNFSIEISVNKDGQIITEITKDNLSLDTIALTDIELDTVIEMYHGFKKKIGM